VVTTGSTGTAVVGGAKECDHPRCHFIGLSACSDAFSMRNHKQAGVRGPTVSLALHIANLPLLRPHRMHKVRTIATDVPVACCLCLSVILSVRLSVTRLRPEKSAGWSEVLFAAKILGDPRCVGWRSRFPCGSITHSEGTGGSVQPSPNYLASFALQTWS